MVEHDLSEIRIREGDTAINLRKGPLGQVAVAGSPQLVHLTETPAQPQLPAAGQEVSQPTPDEGLLPVNSPMVGTYYSASDPESPPFVSVGSEISVGSTVCIIEAMKVFNEIKSEVDGIVEQILVSNEQPVEYGQPLMLVRPKS
ncbi:MAG: acetyl-CoA carboxylase biotin carboxyl carrier protein [Planctomycetota bacterium]|nr:MAG: acetyl-CoA carboxylase biotin carboxyl carrier protein [Planctomycetota bacterium]